MPHERSSTLRLALQGRFHVWGVTAAGASVVLRLHGFCPYLYIATPRKQASNAVLCTIVCWSQLNRFLLARQLPLLLPLPPPSLLPTPNCWLCYPTAG